MFFLDGFLKYFLLGLAASFLFLAIFEFSLRVKKEQISWSYRMIAVLTGLYLT